MLTKWPLDEMAEVIMEIDAGGMKGLEYFFEIDNPTTEEVTKALDEVYIYLDRHLTDAQKRLMGFDILMVEHALCKYSRCHFYGWI